MKDKVIFCTSHIDPCPERYQEWINYYRDFFEDQVDLFMINDGPYYKDLDLKNTELYSFPENLGRKSVWVFPGWKRSFYYAIKVLSERYEKIAHIESDCWVTKNGREEFLLNLNRDGHRMAWCPSYGFPESSLQILNEKWVRQYFIDKYSCRENWYENINFEKDLESLNPSYFMNGDRIESHHHRFQKSYNYVSGLRFDDFKKLYQ